MRIAEPGASLAAQWLRDAAKDLCSRASKMDGAYTTDPCLAACEYVAQKYRYAAVILEDAAQVVMIPELSTRIGPNGLYVPVGDDETDAGHPTETPCRCDPNCPWQDCGHDMRLIRAEETTLGYADLNPNKQTEIWECLVCHRKYRRQWKWTKEPGHPTEGEGTKGKPR